LRDEKLPLAEIRRLQEIVDGETAPRAVQLRMLGAFAAVALLLAGIGLHGLLAFMVSTQTREIGVRIALGVGLGYVAGRTMEALLAGVSPTDPLASSMAVGLVLAVTLAGTLVPAIRAVRIDPLTAIRAE
jgi:ABC-type antimicrobial peptide transport system permease subunit